jgi:hypothetical protein
MQSVNSGSALIIPQNCFIHIHALQDALPFKHLALHSEVPHTIIITIIIIIIITIIIIILFLAL